jgi:hypothetical protein
MTLAYSARTAIAAAVNSLEAQGRVQGWKKVQTDVGPIWVCPACVKTSR